MRVSGAEVALGAQEVGSELGLSNVTGLQVYWGVPWGDSATREMGMRGARCSACSCECLVAGCAGTRPQLVLVGLCVVVRLGKVSVL